MVPSLMPKVRRRVLPNGVTVLLHDNPASKAFCMGVWLKVGSRDEQAGEEGLSHFLEHMLFKGTARRSAFQISQAIEEVGGSLDAFTTKEQICVYALVLENHRQLAFDVLSDMFMNSTFPPGQIRRERQVVLDEISDAMDSPDDLVHEVFADMIFPDHPLGSPILGRKATVAKFSRKKVVAFKDRVLRGDSVVISICGNAGMNEIIKACGRLFKFPEGRAPRRNARLLRRPKRRKFLKRDLHQQYICMGARAFSYDDPRRFPLMVLTNLLGGGMSSRLFQKVREELGLAYNVFTYSEYGRDSGLMGTYMSVKPSRTAEAIRAVMEEFKKVAGGRLKNGELEAAKEYIKGRILLGLETASARMMRMARNEIYFGRQVGEGELIRRIDSVDKNALVEIASKLLDTDNLSIVSMGPSSAGLR